MRKKRFKIINSKAAGIDVGSEVHYVSVGDLSSPSVRQFGCFSEDLKSLTNWLLDVGINTVAMESTGVYWVNLYEILEQSGIEVCLVNARHIKNVPGRKTDVQDSQWLQQLHSYGLLQSSFIGSEKIRELRSYVRQRENLQGQKSRQLHLMGKALELLNIKLQKVVSKLSMQASMKIIRSIVSGERDLDILVSYKHPQMKCSDEDLKKSLDGNWRDEHIFSLKMALVSYDFFIEQMRLCDQQIEKVLSELSTGSSDERRPKAGLVRQNEYSFDASSYLNEIAGVEITRIKGLKENSLLTIFSETGSDLTKWPTAKHFTSWLGLTPRPKISGAKVIGHFKSTVASRSNQAFRNAAYSLHSSPCHLGGLYRRLSIQKSSKKAIKAVARKLAVIFWNMMVKKTEFNLINNDEYLQRQREKTIKRLKYQAEKHGFQLTSVLSDA
jgi:transposase